MSDTDDGRLFRCRLCGAELRSGDGRLGEHGDREHPDTIPVFEPA